MRRAQAAVSWRLRRYSDTGSRCIIPERWHAGADPVLRGIALIVMGA
ncbi:hypothetical protein FHR97_000984 [Halomonas stenophila]|uniref:Uncharacterized protein n=1 Tax=Halomonas stenophila TaxID=795312 RepID=A0A7W5ETP8_9GAMM|nr:hypothetical protein [Halomonas stenophila]